MSRKRMGTNELLAILAMAGITGVSAASAVEAQKFQPNERADSLLLAEQQTSGSGGKQMACGKCGANSCGYKYYSKLENKAKSHKSRSAHMKRLRKSSASAATSDQQNVGTKQ